MNKTKEIIAICNRLKKTEKENNIDKGSGEAD